jgi:hypothetical protein
MQKLFSNIVLAFVLATNVVLASQAQSGGVPVTGRYSNYDYAFSVSVPNGITAFRNRAPFPNHGFGIDISKSQQSYLWIDASYNGLEWKSFDDAIKANLEFLRREGAAEVKLTEQSSTYLSRLRAVRFVAKYNLSGKPMAQESILAFRREKNKEEIVYSINLRTPTNRFERDRALVAEMQSTWRLQRQP